MPRPAALALLAGLAVALAVAAAAPRPADAAPWLTLDQASAEPSELPGMARVRLYVSAIALQGSVIDIAPRDWSLQIGGSRRKIPYIVGSYDAVAGAETAIVIVLQLSRDYEEYTEEGQPTLRALDKIREELTGFLDGLPKKTQVAIVGFGESVQGGLRFVPANQAAKQLDKLSSESEPAPPVLLKAIDRAVRALARKAKPSVPGAPLRRMIVVFADGQDEEPSPERYRSVGRRADKDDVRIHAIAFSPGDQRAPLLGLGELSKRSHGSFRWVRTTAQLDGFKQQLANLTREIQRQYVLTFFLPPEEVEGKRFKVSTSVGGKELVSAEARVDKLTCGAGTCSGDQWCAAEVCVSRALPDGRGFFGWLLLLGGIGVAIAGAIGGAVWLLGRRRGSVAPGAPPPGAMPPGPPPPGPPPAPPGPPPGQIMGQVAGQPHAGYPATGAYPPAGPPTAGHGVPPAPYTGAHAAAAAPQVQGIGPSLLVLTGPYEGRRLPLHHGFSMGKAPGSNLDLSADPYASGQHAQVLVDGRGSCTLVDRNSTNGTFINGVRLLGQQPLSHGMLIRLGSTDVRFLQQ